MRIKRLLLIGMLILTAAGAQRRQPDPLQPDAVKFCQHMDNMKVASYCDCPTAYEGTLCKSEEPLPNFCKRMCGHARQCMCCGLHK